ncbi:uncharacterized protein L201_006599 [Kwoniella dendrophila CBS 6074]|uniref:Uncharacterized protein n=1 Tax=Kwoniella dendrophila CBS 6074 TaxID=1295534 RepID=A0AAX4K3J2_9TREE
MSSRRSVSTLQHTSHLSTNGSSSSCSSISSKRPLLPRSQISSLSLPPLAHPISQRNSFSSTSASSSTYIPKKPNLSSSSLIQSIQRRQSSIFSKSKQQQEKENKMSASEESIPQIIIDTRNAASGVTGESVEPRQTLPTEDMEPDTSKSIPLPPNRQKLIDDVIALYSCQPTVERVARYAPACVYDDQFVYANDRYKMAGQWFGLPKLFPQSDNLGYEIVKNDDTLIQFKNKQRWHFHLIPKTATINALVSIVLDPATKDSDFPLILYHKDQANEKDYSHEGFGFNFKKTQADLVMKFMGDKEVKYFKGDENATKEPVKKYGSGTAEAPLATHV